MRYEVRVKVAASCRRYGGEQRAASVEADSNALAIVAASAVLEREGVDRWTLVQVVLETS